MIENIGVAVAFYAFFTESKVGKTGLTNVKIDAWRITTAGVVTQIVTDADATEVGGGFYRYQLAAGSNTVEGELLAVGKTATTSVDQQHLPAAWYIQKAGTENLDALVSSRAAIDDYTSVRATKLDNLDAPISSRLSLIAYTIPDNANIVVAALAATDAAMASISADGKATTILNRLGAFAGAGLNTVLGLLRAIMRSDSALTPSDVGGTYDNEEHSLEALEAGVTTGASLVINATAPALSTIAADGSLEIHRGDYTEFELTLGNVADRAGEKLIFTLKPRKDDEDDDSEAYLQVTELSGAVLVNGSSDDVEPTDASLTVLNAATGVTRFIFKSDITDLLPIGTDFWFDVQRIAADGERHTTYERRAMVTRDVTRRTV